MFSPASRQISTSRVASATSLAPQALKNSFPPPNVPVPKLNTGTFNPEPPNCRYSIFIPEFELAPEPAPELDAPPPAPSRIKSIPATPTPQNGSPLPPLRTVADDGNPEPHRSRNLAKQSQTLASPTHRNLGAAPSSFEEGAGLDHAQPTPKRQPPCSGGRFPDRRVLIQQNRVKSPLPPTAKLNRS